MSSLLKGVDPCCSDSSTLLDTSLLPLVDHAQEKRVSLDHILYTNQKPSKVLCFEKWNKLIADTLRTTQCYARYPILEIMIMDVLIFLSAGMNVSWTTRLVTFTSSSRASLHILVIGQYLHSTCKIPMEFEKNPYLHSTPIEHINLQIFLIFVIWSG